MNYPLVILGIISLLLALPTLIAENSLKRLTLAFLASSFGIVLPLLVFFFSAFLVPQWKGGCPHGWLDCFHLGKLALAPVVLWATIALYAVEICRLPPPISRDLVMGLFLGMLVAGGCFIYGAITFSGQAPAVYLVVPLYTAIWYGIRLVQAHKHSHPKPKWYFAYFLGSLPFWIGGLMWSRRIFATLPNNPPECFVVTAASRGHHNFVGPFAETIHRGQRRQANHQLITFWNFEQLWRELSPLTHRWLRHIYNRVGPAVARRITSPWMADVVYLALKPAEWTARSLGYLAMLRIRSLKSQPGAML
jgi:hypothetical protein